MDKPKHIVKRFEQLPIELRARLRLNDPTLAIIHWRSQTSADCTLLEFVDLVDTAHDAQHGWIWGPCRVQRFGAGVATELTGLGVAGMLWIESDNAVWVEDMA